MKQLLIHSALKIISLDNAIKRSGQNLFLPFYHTVYKETPLSYIAKLYPMKSVKQFNRDLDVLLKYYNPVDLDFVIKHAMNPQKTAGRMVHLSFDDGLRGCYDLIMPELIKRGIPATFFINPNFIDNRNLFYRYKIGLILARLEGNSRLSNEVNSALGTMSDTKTQLLNLKYHDIDLIESIGDMIGLKFSDFLMEEKPYLETSQIKEMIHQGFTIGAHSMDHPRFSDISEEEQWRQVKDSVDVIRKKFNLNYGAFAFPFSDDGVGKRLIEKITNNDVADISFGTAGVKSTNLMMHLERTPMEKGHDSAEQIIHEQYVYFLLKSILGKQKRIFK